MNGRNSLVYGKILLFGEYSILLESKALTIPLTHFSGRLQLPDAHPSPAQSASNRLLHKYYGFLASKEQHSMFPFINFTAFYNDVKAGLHFESDLPQGYGVGSSGALVAAIYRRYNADWEKDHAVLDLKILQNKLASLEGYFHGRSSGIDPLSCYLGVPLEFLPEGGIRQVQISNALIPEGAGFFLLDTGLKRKTSELVNLFQEKITESTFREIMQAHYKIAVNNCIDSLMEGKIADFDLHMKQLSELQFRFFQEMIPDSYIDMWATGLHTGAFTLKLCGAGGGGFILGYTVDFSQLGRFVKNTPVISLAL